MYEEEQRGYYILSSFWAELDKDQVLGEPAVVRAFDMHTCTLEDVQVRKHAPTRRRAFRLCIASRCCFLLSLVNDAQGPLLAFDPRGRVLCHARRVIMQQW